MKWLSNFFKKPAAQPVAQASPVSPKSPAEAIEPLRERLAAAADATQRQQLAARLGGALAERSQAPQADDLPEVWLAAICQAADKEQALAWLATFDGDNGLAEVATRARRAEVRYAAAQRIAATDVLEQVAQASRDKDKRVYRHCAEQLKQRRLAAASARRAQEINAELQGLLAEPPLPNTRLLELKQELASLVDAGEPGLAGQALMQQALAQLHQESEALRDLHAQRKTADLLAAECRAAVWPWGEQLQGWRHRCDELRSNTLPSWLAGQSAAHALSQTLSEVETRLSALAEDQQRGLACELFLAALDQAAEPVADAAQAWAALAKPEHAQVRAVLEENWQLRWRALKAAAPAEAVRAAPPAEAENGHENSGETRQDAAAASVGDQTPASPRSPQRVDPAALHGLLEQLEQTIAQGHLAESDAVAKRIKSRIGGARLPAALDSRWHSLQAQLETLRGWARWGAGQARDKLIDAARQLLVGEHDVAALAAAIAALREEWKRLDAHAAAGKAQWQSFDALLEQAYQPVAAQRAEQAARQAEARAAREALCAEWEAELAGMDSSQADFKALEARRAEWIQQWRAAAPLGFKDERLLRKRFDALIHGIDQPLAAARAAEYTRREQLIAAAEALSGQSDLKSAMQEAKALQQRWSQGTPVRLKRSDEQKQWTRFRAACNAVFERLDNQRAVQAAERQEQAQIRQQQLQAQQQLELARQEKQRARFELLAQKAALANRVEAAASAGGPVEALLAEAKQAWDALANLPAKSESLLASRFARAASVTAAELSRGRAVCDDLLLDLEIALGLPSPEPVADLRRERQLGRLQTRFGGAAETQRDVEEMLLRCYATAASPDAASEQRLAAVAHKLAEQSN